MNTQYEVRLGNVTEVKSDLLLLKHAQNFFGADGVVASSLIASGICTESEMRVARNQSRIVETNGTLAPQRVMFLGTSRLSEFGYDEMQQFARRAIAVVAELKLPVNVLTTTIHGGGYGLDPGESLQRLVRGFQEGLAEAGHVSVEKIVFLTLSERERRTLTTVLEKMAPQGRIDRPETDFILRSDDAGRASTDDTPFQHLRARAATRTQRTAVKKVAFVAMPYTEEFENVYEFGIYPAVTSSGLICEKVDETHFTGDILTRITHGIRAASIVIADLSQARPNVYLEVGYAWGLGKKVIFIARKGEELHFDVKMHNCLYYGKFSQLKEDLERLLRGLEKAGEL